MSETPDERESRRKRVLYRSHHTGMKENDLLIGQFADRHLAELSDADVEWLEQLLSTVDDIDLNQWITGRAPIPEAHDHPVLRSILHFKYTV